MGPGLRAIPLEISRAELSFLRFTLEAHEGLALIYGDGQGRVEVICPAERFSELWSLLLELRESIDFTLIAPSPPADSEA